MDTKNNDLILFKSLIRKFYDASITPEETRILNETADRLLSVGEHSAATYDPDLKADLALVVALRNMSEKAMDEFEMMAPAGLEERLEGHIHNLASAGTSGRHPFRTKKWLRAGVAAAVVATVITGGIRFLTAPDAPSGNTGTNTSLASTVSADSSRSAVKGAPVITADTTQTLTPTISPVSSPAKPHIAQAGHIAAHEEMPDDTPEIAAPQEEVIPADEEIDDTEYFSPQIPDEPLIASAEMPEQVTFPLLPPEILPAVNPEQSLKLPLTTLSAGIDNVFRSISLLSESLSVAFSPTVGPEDDSAAPSIPTQPI